MLSLKQLKKQVQQRLKMVEKIPKTYEQICLDKLEEIGTSTAAEWSFAMGYESRNGLIKVIKRIKTNMPEKLIIYSNKKPRRYEVKHFD
jgi:hypothetical protein